MGMSKEQLEQTLGGFDGRTEVPDVAAALRSIASEHRQGNYLLRAFSPRALARTALTAASVSPPDVEVLSAVCGVAPVADLAQLDPVDLATLAWALAAASHRDVPTMTAVGDQVAERAWEFSAEELSKTVIAFAELSLCHRAMMDAVSMEA